MHNILVHGHAPVYLTNFLLMDIPNFMVLENKNIKFFHSFINSAKIVSILCAKDFSRQGNFCSFYLWGEE